MAMSERVRQRMSQGSLIRKMFDEGAILKERFGSENVFDLSLGNPIMEPPAEFHEELRKIAAQPQSGMHRYMANAGYAETRAAVADYLTNDTGISFTENDIVMTCGAAGALNVVLKTILNPGEEVIIFAPYFVEYLSYVDNHGGVSIVLETDEQFIPRFDILEDAINPKTKAVIVNSPNNPTGVVYSAEVLKKLGELLRKKEEQFGTKIFIISDEAYRRIIYDGLAFPWPFHCHPQTIVTTSHSKDLALPGERIGYIALHPDCVDKADLMNGFIFCNCILGFVNAPALMQNVVRSLQNVSVSVAEYQKKRDLLYSNLVSMGYSLNKPQGAFYLFPRTPGGDDSTFISELQEMRILAVPGRGFGTPGYFRISYCVDDRTVEGSLNGFRRIAEKYGMC